MANRLPPLNALRAFEAAARHLSFMKAAEELHVTPAAISHQIKALEEYLDVQLFRRLNRKLELTDVAQACLPKLREGFDCLVEAIRRVRAHESIETLAVSVAPALASKWLIPRLHRFVTAHPDVDVRITASIRLIDVKKKGRSASMEQLGHLMEDTDIAIRFGTGEYPGFRVDKLFSVSVIPMCSPQLLKGEHPLRQPEDLRHHTLIQDDTVYFDEAKPDWEKWLKAAGVKGVDATRGPHFSHAALALEAAADGLGVALGILKLAASDLAAGRLVIPFQLSLPLHFAYYVLCAGVACDRPDVAVFRNWLLEEAERDEAKQHS